MAYAPNQWQSTTIANTATNSSVIDLGRIYDKIQIEFGAMDATSFNVAVGRSAGGTFYPLSNEALVDITTGNTQRCMNIYGNQFLKVTCNNAQTAARTIWYRGIAD